MKCPKCNQNIPNINILYSSARATCDACEHNFFIDERYEKNPELIVETPAKKTEATTELDLDNIPGGCWLKKKQNSYVIGAKCLSFQAILLISFTVVWARGSMWTLYGQQFTDGQFSLFKSLFGIPFLLGTIFLVLLCLTSLIGKEEVQLDTNTCTLFIGIGSIGWKRKLDVKLILSVLLKSAAYSQKELKVIYKTANQSYAIGRMLNTNRKEFMYKALKSALDNQKKGKNYFNLDLSSHLLEH